MRHGGEWEANGTSEGGSTLATRRDDILAGLAEAVIEMEEDRARALAEEAVALGMDAYEAIMQ